VSDYGSVLTRERNLPPRALFMVYASNDDDDDDDDDDDINFRKAITVDCNK